MILTQELYKLGDDILPTGFLFHEGDLETVDLLLL